MKKNIKPAFGPLLLIVSFLISPLLSDAQETSITIKVINQKREPLPFASVRVTNHPDTLKVQQKVADSSGVVVFRL
ncbi:MAG TPA: hypothetical protein VF476_17805, partial [Chitinophagaceae bacterium]